MWSGSGAVLQILLMSAWIRGASVSGVLSPGWSSSASLAWSFAQTVMMILGLRLCSAVVEDRHHIRSGRILTALLRPGYLEAGGQVPRVLLCFLTEFRFTLQTASNALVLCDAQLFGYCAFTALSKMGCVSYGCCWGKQVKHPFPTVYRSNHSKCVRVDPSTKGKELYPVSVVIAILFAINTLLCILWSRLIPYYVPGLIYFLLQQLNQVQRRFYFPYRADGEGKAGYNKEEDFFVLSPSEKMAYCSKWSLFTRAVGWGSFLFSVHHCLFGGTLLGVEITLDTMRDVLTDAAWLPASFSSFLFVFFATGYHYRFLGRWTDRRFCTEKKTFN